MLLVYNHIILFLNPLHPPTTLKTAWEILSDRELLPQTHRITHLGSGHDHRLTLRSQRRAGGSPILVAHIRKGTLL